MKKARLVIKRTKKDGPIQVLVRVKNKEYELDVSSDDYDEPVINFDLKQKKNQCSCSIKVLNPIVDISYGKEIYK